MPVYGDVSYPVFGFATIWDDRQGYGLLFNITFAVDPILNCTIPLTMERETMIVHYMSSQQFAFIGECREYDSHWESDITGRYYCPSHTV